MCIRDRSWAGSLLLRTFSKVWLLFWAKSPIVVLRGLTPVATEP
jgi:hypothetical protein